MDEEDEFGDLYSDVLQPFQPPVVLPPPPPLPHRSIDLNLRSQDQEVAEANSASVARVSDNDADKDMSFDIEEPDADSTPTIPVLFVAASEAGALPGLATDRGVSQVTTRIEQAGGDGGYGGQGEGDDWDSDSEDDLQIVLNAGFSKLKLSLAILSPTNSRPEFRSLPSPVNVRESSFANGAESRKIWWTREDVEMASAEAASEDSKKSPKKFSVKKTLKLNKLKLIVIVFWEWGSWTRREVVHLHCVLQRSLELAMRLC